MSNFYNDNNIPYGVPVVTIGSIGYIAESIELNRASKIIERTDGNDEPSGWIGIPGFDTGSALVQVATPGQAIPTRGVTFSYKSSTWVVTEVGEPVAKDADWKVNLTIRKDV